MKIITKFPTAIDPVRLIEEKVLTCPLCGQVAKANPLRISFSISNRDKHGKEHYFLDFLNKYNWKRYSSIHCNNCGCTWDTGWYPADYEMFEVDLNADKEQIKKELIRKINEW